MSLWSEFNASSEDQWIKKVLDDSSNKTAQDFHWKTEYGNINTFSKAVSVLKSDKRDKLSEISWNFEKEKNINSQILNRLKDGINSIHIDGINYADSIFKNVMNDIINNHIILSHKATKEDISSWTDWINSNPNFKCIYLEIPSKYLSFKNYSSEIALTGAYLNEIIEIHKKNNIEIPKKIILKSFLDNSFLENISKLKAVKSIINQVLKIHSIKANVIVETSLNPEILKDKSEDFRILSITSTAMSSFIGGSNSFVLSDSLLISKENYSKKIAANIPLILNEESQINILKDVTKGAHVIEQISFKMANKGWRMLKQIEVNGGLLKNLKNSNLKEFIKN
ncbi:MAG: methylmalonyl-CoA mutase family protein [Flavobacteriales bacterium]|nr:methylmalonyl-CoA mutase family protein [Flavobacteriales bacterium]